MIRLGMRHAQHFSLHTAVKQKSRKPFLQRISDRALLRRQDSNMRPPGYEPGELPTAPLRDVNVAAKTIVLSLGWQLSLFLNCECKVTMFILNVQIFT